jgi:hypothetical protein
VPGALQMDVGLPLRRRTTGKGGGGPNPRSSGSPVRAWIARGWAAWVAGGECGGTMEEAQDAHTRKRSPEADETAANERDGGRAK